jgi:hypothetical protein
VIEALQGSSNMHNPQLESILGSQERTVEEYTALLRRAQFELVRVVPTQEPLSIVEAVPM